MNREQLSNIIGNIDDRLIAEAAHYDPAPYSGSPERIIPMKKRRFLSAALAAALLLALGVTAYAVFGYRSVVSYEMPGTGDYTSLSDLKRIEKIVGYPVAVPEDFSDGYAFSLLSVKEGAVYDENNRMEKQFRGVHVVYTKEGGAERYLDLEPVLGTDSTEPDELRTIEGVSVSLSLDHYKVVPEDYQKTEEDLTKEAAGHFYISYGSDRITEYNIASAVFKIENVKYSLMDMSANRDTLEELSRMAAEVIAKSK